ncbi:MAG: hypothetical protein HY715_02190 [Planctomycetes bacterium]|nr:hypothetical protein [Planctomycetota bacterium]
MLHSVLCLLLAGACQLFCHEGPAFSAPGGWAATYGGFNDDWAESVQETSDGDYVVAGYASSFEGGGLWVLKLRPDGTIDWQKTYGGIGAESIHETRDGGYIVTGKRGSLGAGGKEIHHLWVLRLRSDGTVDWQRTYGEDYEGGANSIQQTSSGGYIVAGWTKSFGAGALDFWVLKLRADGTVEWQKTYGGVGRDEAYSVHETRDGGYIVAGLTESFGVGKADAWVLKLGMDGQVEWQKTYGGEDFDFASCIHETRDGGYIMAGETGSCGAGETDIWVLKLGMDGQVEWQKTYGGISYDLAHSIHETRDGGYIVAGLTMSFGVGKADVWVLKLDTGGTIDWQKTYGGIGWDEAKAIQQARDEGYIVAGLTDSFGTGYKNFLVLKLRPDGTTDHSCDFVRDTSISGKDSSATVKTTKVDARDSNAHPKDSLIMVWATDVPANILCP